MSKTLKDRPQPRRDKDEPGIRREKRRLERSKFRKRLRRLDPGDLEELDDLDGLERFERMQVDWVPQFGATHKNSNSRRDLSIDDRLNLEKKQRVFDSGAPGPPNIILYPF